MVPSRQHPERCLGLRAALFLRLRDRAELVLEDIIARYSEPSRHYHNMRHIWSVLQFLQSVLGDENVPAVKLAGWLHDVIYDSRAGDNELRSAEYAREVLASLGAPAELREETARLILLTRTHETTADDVHGQALLDADLGIFAANPAIYDDYASAIRQEYSWVADAEYRAGRRKVLGATSWIVRGFTLPI